jgi:hypothetical protein
MPITINSNATHHGLVLTTYERYEQAGLRLYAAVWNPAAQCLESIPYSDTHEWKPSNNATPDASPEVIAAARQWQTKQAKRRSDWIASGCGQTSTKCLDERTIWASNPTPVPYF